MFTVVDETNAPCKNKSREMASARVNQHFRKIKLENKTPKDNTKNTRLNSYLLFHVENLTQCINCHFH
jgi:hypothetical protein